MYINIIVAHIGTHTSAYIHKLAHILKMFYRVLGLTILHTNIIYIYNIIFYAV